MTHQMCGWSHFLGYETNSTEAFLDSLRQPAQSQRKLRPKS